MPSRSRVIPAHWIGAVALALALLSLVFAESAGAFVYWTNTSGGSIGRAMLDGAGANHRFMTVAGFPEDIEVDAGHIYWTNASDAIGRANIGGTSIDPAFITGTGETDGVAVDADHVYWTNHASNTIGRANLNGTGVNQTFISGASGPVRIAVDANHVYWTNNDTKAIGRANLDGSGVDQSFITTLGFPGGLTVDADHVYWVNSNIAADFSGAIGRANLDGSGVEQVFTFSPAAGASPTFPAGLAVDAGHIYWADFANGTVVRSTLDGTTDVSYFIFGASFPLGVAVDSRPLPPDPPPPDPPPETTITKRPPNKTRKRNVKFRFVSSEPGSSFRCKLDRRPFRPCESPKKLRRLKKGKHRFKVRAINAAGIPDPTPAKDRFKVLG
ncbi:MAG: hypothetical protein WBC01_13155 [Solirubrobacterales bacterium]